MKNIFCLLLLAVLMLEARRALSQGWSARVVLNFNSGSSPLASVDNATISFSGATSYAWSGTSNLAVDLTGTGIPSGPLYVVASGPSAFNPQEIAYISTSFEGPFEANCNMYYLDLYGTASQYVTGTFTLYSRLEISHFTEECNRIRLTTDVCSPRYTWEVSENLSGPFKILTNTHTSGISLSGEDLAAIGFNKYGRKYFRVTGLTGTTSPMVPVYLFAPGPSADFSLIPPTCHNGTDGAIRLKIFSADPGIIDDFVVTVKNEDETSPIQLYPNNTDEILITGLSPTKYSITIENNTNISIYGACLSSFSVGPIANPDKVQLSSIEVSDHHGFAISCKDGSDGYVKVTPTGGTGLYSAFEWTPNVSTTSMATNLPAGTYNVKVRDSHGCASDEYSSVLEAPGKVVVEIQSFGGKNGYGVSCHNSYDGEIAAFATGGVAGYTYTWSGGTTSDKLIALGTGTYEVSVSDANGCMATAVTILEAPDPIDFTIQQLSTIKCAGDKTAALEVQSVENTIGTVFYQWSTGDVGQSITGKSAGHFSVAVSDDQGCSQTKGILLEDPPAYTVDLIALSDFNGSPIRCNGESNGSIVAKVKDGTGEDAAATHYTWYRGENEVVAGSGQPLLEAIGAGSYTVKVEYHEGCMSSNVLVIGEPDPLQTSIRTVTDYHGFPLSCNGATDGAILAQSTGGTGGHVYLWENGTAEASRQDLGAGKYTVVVSDDNGCEAYAETILSAPEQVEAQIHIISDFNGMAVSCTENSDGHLRGSAQGGTSPFLFVWNTGANTPDLTGISAGHYSLTATDINGCSALREITLEAPPPVTVFIHDSSDYNAFGVSCYESEDGFLLAGAAGGTGSYRYKWLDTSHSDPYYDHLPAGKYTVVVTDQNGCTGSAFGELTMPQPLIPLVVASKNISCNEGRDGEIELTVSGGAGGYTYLINDETWQEEPRLTAVGAGQHTLQVRDINGCSQSIPHTLTEPEPLSITFTDVEPALCGEARGRVSSVVSGGTGTFAYHWTGAQGVLPSFSQDLADLLPGVYTLRVTDENSCQTTESVGVPATDGPKIKMTALESPTCAESEDGSAMVEVVDGDGPYKFLWNDGQLTFTATGLRRGHHLVEVRDANDCLTTGDIDLTAPEPIEINLLERSEPICHGDCNGSIKVIAEGGNGDYEYAWPSSTGPGATDLCAGQYRIKVTDRKGCTADNIFDLGQPQPLTTTARVAAAPSCPGACDGSLQIQANGGTGILQYVWSTGDTTQDLFDLCEGTYTLTVTDENNCAAPNLFSLEDPEGAVIDLGDSATICGGQAFTLDAGPRWKRYLWESTTDFTSSAQQIILSEGGTYWLTATATNGCLSRDTFYLKTSDDLLNANFLLATEASARDTLVAIDISWPIPENIVWTFPNEMVILKDQRETVYGRFDQDGYYSISLLATLGECRDEITKTVAIVSEKNGPPDNGRLGSESFVKKFELYPNPNNGVFDLQIEFADPSPVLLTVWNTLIARPVLVVEDTGSSKYKKHFDLQPLSAGNYTLRMDYKNGTRYVRFVVR